MQTTPPVEYDMYTLQALVPCAHCTHVCIVKTLDSSLYEE